MSDPFSDVVAAIWTTLEASTDFKARVPAANRLKLTGSVEGQMDDDARDQIYPSIRIVLAQGEFDQAADSSASTLDCVWEVQIYVPNERAAATFYPLLWSTLRALAAAFPASSTLRSLTFTSKTYVRAGHLKHFRSKWDDGNENSTVNIKRWQCLWAMRTLLQFDRTDLAPSA